VLFPRFAGDQPSLACTARLFWFIDILYFLCYLFYRLHGSIYTDISECPETFPGSVICVTSLPKQSAPFFGLCSLTLSLAHSQDHLGARMLPGPFLMGSLQAAAPFLWLSRVTGGDVPAPVPRALPGLFIGIVSAWGSSPNVAVRSD